MDDKKKEIAGAVKDTVTSKRELWKQQYISGAGGKPSACIFGKDGGNMDYISNGNETV